MADAIVMAGSTRARPAATGSAQPCRGNPPEGNVPASRANSQIRITPTQKIGTATPTWDSAETASPTGESRRTAASVAKGKETRVGSAKAASESGTVMGGRPATRSPKVSCETNEVVEPDRNSPSHAMYCTGNGSSAPS